jgi:hypothetical protein
MSNASINNIIRKFKLMSLTDKLYSELALKLYTQEAKAAIPFAIHKERSIN